MHQSVSERGQGFVEYAMIILLVALAVIAILALIGPALSNAYQNIIRLI